VEEESEDIEVLEIPFQQALEMIKTGEIKDGKTIMLLQYAQIHNLI
jgi:GDP-mannose pyrophosphatase NudK